MKLSPEQVQQKRLERDILFKTTFALEYGDQTEGEPIDLIVSDLQERKGKPVLFTEEQRNRINKVAKNILDHKQELDQRIEKYLKGWKIGRLSSVDLTILRIATYELIYTPETPGSVVINEAVVLAGKFDDDKAKSFVNGALSSIHKELESAVHTGESM